MKKILIAEIDNKYSKNRPSDCEKIKSLLREYLGCGNELTEYSSVSSWVFEARIRKRPPTLSELVALIRSKLGYAAEINFEITIEKRYLPFQGPNNSNDFP